MQPQERTPLSIEHMQNGAMNLAEIFCSVIAMPVEQILRPRYGSRYCPPAVAFFAAVVMVVLPMVDALASSYGSLLNLAARIQPPQALFGIASLSKLFFLVCVIHGFRVYWRMFKPESELNSHFEGPPLPFFPLLPGGKNFWFTRLVLEPAFVLVTATALERAFIFQPGLAHYLQFAALCLAMKNFISWYKSFQFLRDVLDARNAGPIISRFVENAASQDELSSLHLASLPKDLNPELRRSTAVHIARVFSPGTTIPDTPKGDS
jgi:hypothetical protein